MVSGNTVNPLRFGGRVGYWRDEAERLDVRVRHLRTDMGRWMSRDPMGFMGGDWNLYGYVGNIPMINLDPSGSIIFKKRYHLNVSCSIMGTVKGSSPIDPYYPCYKYACESWARSSKINDNKSSELCGGNNCGINAMYRCCMGNIIYNG